MKYEEIAALLEHQIQEGMLEANAKLPSLREMAEQCSVSIGTVRAAYQELEKRHQIYAVSKSGYFVVGTAENRCFRPIR